MPNKFAVESVKEGHFRVDKFLGLLLIMGGFLLMYSDRFATAEPRKEVHEPMDPESSVGPVAADK